jgi:hypothetical protein
VRVALVLVMIAIVGATTVSRAASAPPSPWDGTNPFNCVLQNAGLGPTGPDPAADPYCVYFDKTHQNVSQRGIVDFVSKEPARTAAASPKCFYFQQDHWRSSVVQSDSRTVVYEWVGHYFFNKATGDGGVYVSGFSINGQTFDPTMLPGFPPQYGGYFGPGTGGVITHNAVPADPRCVALAARKQIYPAGGTRCVPGVGKVKRRVLGPVTIGQREDSVRAELGPPQDVKRGFLRYCVSRGGSLLVGERGDRSGTFGSGGSAPAVMLATTSRGFAWAGRVHVGSRLRRHGRRLARGTVVVRLRRGVVAVISHRRVRELVVYDPAAIRGWRTLRGYLSRSRSG